MQHSTFFIISAINTQHSKFTPDTRFKQTLETIESIRRQAPGANILFTDNSTAALTSIQRAILTELVDHYVDLDTTLFTRYINIVGENKGLNEMLAYDHLLGYAEKNGCIGNRIFKLSGRYQLAEQFNHWEYHKPQYRGKYVFKVTPWIYNDGDGKGEYIKYFFNTALWSLCYSLVADYKQLLQGMFNWMMLTGENIEMAHNSHIPRDKLIIAPVVHGHGWITNGEWTEF